MDFIDNYQTLLENKDLSTTELKNIFNKIKNNEPLESVEPVESNPLIEPPKPIKKKVPPVQIVTPIKPAEKKVPSVQIVVPIKPADKKVVPDISKKIISPPKIKTIINISDGITLNCTITHLCNIQCTNCPSYAPLEKLYDKGWKVDLQKLIVDVNDINKIVPIKRLNIHGGEPFLDEHNLIIVITELRRLLPKTKICLYTSGALIAVRTPAVLKALTKYRIHLIINLPSKFNTAWNDNIQEILDYHKVKFTLHIFNRRVCRKFDFHNTYDNDTACRNLTLFKSKLYLCSRQAYLYLLDNKFNTAYSEQVEFIPVESLTERLLFGFLNSSNNMCNFCKRCENIPVTASRGRISEWIENQN